MSSSNEKAEDALAADEAAGRPDPNADLQRMMAEGRSFSSHERNCCFLNTQGSAVDRDRFATVSAVTGIDLDDDGRALAAVDWDHDGDLDLWVSNRNAPRLRFFRNQTDNGNRFVQFRLHGNGTDTNADAIGARISVVLKPSVTTTALAPAATSSPILIKTVTAGDGFQTQSSLVVHFGLGEAGEIERVLVHWPNRAGTTEVFEAVEANHRYDLRQGAGKLQQVAPRTAPLAIEPGAPVVPATDGVHRIPLIYPFAAPEMGYYGFDGQPHDIEFGQGQATLINLWSTTCKPCLQELSEFAAQAETLRAAGVRVIALSVDELETGNPQAVQDAAAMAQRLKLPFEAGMLPPLVADRLQRLHNMLVVSRRPLPMPTSFLINADGKLELIYKGPVSVETLVADARPFQGDIRGYQQRAASLPGIALAEPALLAAWERNRLTIRYKLAKFLAGGGSLESAEREYLAILKEWPEAGRIYNDLGVISIMNKKMPQAVDYLQIAVEREPTFWDFRSNLIRAYTLSGNTAAAKQTAQQAVADFPDKADAHFQLAIALLRERDLNGAKQRLLQAIALDPRNAQARYSLGKLLLEGGDPAAALVHLQQACELDADQPAMWAAWGEAALQNRDFAAAEKALRTAVQLAPQQAAGHYLLGLALAGQSRHVDAASEFQAVLRIDPDFPGVLQALQQSQKAALQGKN